MKKFLSALLLFTVFNCSCDAQDVVSKIPPGATLLIKYAGGNLTKKLPAKKFESYALLKKKLFNAFLPDKNFTLESTGVDLGSDACQYLVSTDSTTSFVTLVPISDATKFAQFVQQKNKGHIPLVKSNGFQVYRRSSGSSIGWSNSMAALVLTSYTSRRYYQPAEPAIDTAINYGGVGKMQPYADSSVALEQAPAIDTAVTEIVDSIATAGDPAETPEQKANREAADLFYAREAVIKDSVQDMVTQAILQSTFGSVAASSITDNPSFAKMVDKNADISLWMDSTSLLGRLTSLYGAVPYKFNYNLFPGFSQAVNIFFEKDKVKIEQQVFVNNTEEAQLFKSVYNSRQNPAFVNYLRSNDIGFVSVSINSEALMKMYYGIAKKVLRAMPYVGKEADLVDACIDIVEIIIDEKAIADVLPGNGLFVLHGVTPRKVTYIGYEYDKDYNSKEVAKTKTEMSPDFSFIFETKNEHIFNKLINLPIKLNKDTSFNYAKTGDFYTLALGEKNIVNRLYFKVADGKCIISTSLKDVAGPGVGSSVDEATRKALLANNYYGNINFKTLITSISADVTDKKNKKMIDYLQANTSNMSLESSISNDTIKTTTLFNITGKHSNSLEYFFNVMENLLKIDAGNKK